MADIEERDLYHREGDPPAQAQDGAWLRVFAVTALTPLAFGVVVIVVWLVLR